MGLEEEGDEASRSWRLMRGGEVLSLLLWSEEGRTGTGTGIGACLSRTKRRWMAFSLCEVEGKIGVGDEEVEVLLGVDLATS